MLTLCSHLYACAVKYNITSVVQTSILRINTNSGALTTVSVLTKAPSGLSSVPDNKMPLFVSFNFGTSKAYLFYTNETTDGKTYDTSALYTFDIESGDLLNQVPVILNTIDTTWMWMMATMNYYQ